MAVHRTNPLIRLPSQNGPSNEAPDDSRSLEAPSSIWCGAQERFSSWNVVPGPTWYPLGLAAFLLLSRLPFLSSPTHQQEHSWKALQLTLAFTNVINYVHEKVIIHPAGETS
jgi:hypothetical protein